MIGGAYAGTLWCYAAMGDAWRMGIRKRERTVLVNRGPYRFVRHPIYLFQSVLFAGAVLLLPTLFLLALLGVHLACVYVKSRDEEAYLLEVHGSSYGDYLSKTGRFFPRLRRGG